MDFSPRRRRRTQSAIDLTPVIDIVFNLLIFFLVTTTFVQNPGIEVDLPKATSAQVDPKAEHVIIAVTSDGRYVHEGKAVSLDELEARLKEHHKQRADAMVIIQADTSTPHGKVVEVMDAARRVGFAQLAIATEAQR
ncbi:MAG: biopolymer transporter ExbD [Deltaproteobacteria bacterium]|nr:biopolymer transporter ExbD [Deltaproteobacteria bacterium]